MAKTAAMSEAHPPRSSDPEPLVLAPETHVRDVATGQWSTAKAWIAARMLAEGRAEDECGDELVNAIARGDVVSER